MSNGAMEGMGQAMKRRARRPQRDADGRGAPVASMLTHMSDEEPKKAWSPRNSICNRLITSDVPERITSL